MTVALAARFRRLLVDGIGLVLPWLIARSLRRDLAAVWQRGSWEAMPAGGAILAANHHSWWDGYLTWLIRRRLGRRAFGIMLKRQLDRFPFFRRLGMIAETEPREAIRRLRAGELLFLFPEGELRPAGGCGPLRPGVAFLARRAGVPVFPLAIRVSLRGSQRPEAFLVLGEPLSPARPDLVTEVRTGIDAALASIDAELKVADPEEAPPGYGSWLRGKGSSDRSAARWEALWRR